MWVKRWSVSKYGIVLASVALMPPRGGGSEKG